MFFRWLRPRENRRPPLPWRKPLTSSASLQPPSSCVTCRRSTPSPLRRTPPSSSRCLLSWWRASWSSDTIGYSGFCHFGVFCLLAQQAQTVNMITVINQGLAGDMVWCYLWWMLCMMDAIYGVSLGFWLIWDRLILKWSSAVFLGH